MNTEEDPVTDRENFKFGLFYYNLNDERYLVRIPGSINRYTFNYARWPIYIIIIPMMLVICYAVSNKLFFS